MRLLLSVRLPWVLTARWLAADCRVQSVLDEAPAYASHRREADIHGDCDLVIGPRRAMRPCLGLQQDPGMGMFSGRASARGYPLIERRPLVFGQRHQIVLAHAGAGPCPAT